MRAHLLRWYGALQRDEGIPPAAKGVQTRRCHLHPTEGSHERTSEDGHLAQELPHGSRRDGRAGRSCRARRAARRSRPQTARRRRATRVPPVRAKAARLPPRPAIRGTLKPDPIPESDIAGTTDVDVVRHRRGQRGRRRRLLGRGRRPQGDGHRKDRDGQRARRRRGRLQLAPEQGGLRDRTHCGAVPLEPHLRQPQQRGVGDQVVQELRPWPWTGCWTRPTSTAPPTRCTPAIRAAPSCPKSPTSTRSRQDRSPSRKRRAISSRRHCCTSRASTKASSSCSGTRPNSWCRTRAAKSPA